MHSSKRYEEYKEESFDMVLMRIRQGKIKCGKYAGLVKIKPEDKIKGKEFFTDGQSEDQDGSD